MSLAGFCVNTVKKLPVPQRPQIFCPDEQLSVSEDFVDHSRMVNGRQS